MPATIECSEPSSPTCSELSAAEPVTSSPRSPSLLQNYQPYETASNITPQSSPLKCDSCMWQAYAFENKGDYSILQEEQNQNLSFDELNNRVSYLESKNKELYEENKELKAVNANLQENADSFLKNENEQLKEKIEELNFLLKFHISNTQNE